MLKKFLRGKYDWQDKVAFISTIFLVGVLFFYNLFLGILSGVLMFTIGYFKLKTRHEREEDLKKYVKTLTLRIKHVNQKILTEFPIGLVLYSENRHVEWHNPFISKLYEKDTLVGVSLYEILPEWNEPSKEKGWVFTKAIQDRTFEIFADQAERIIYYKDITEQTLSTLRYENERIAVGIVMIDNVEEITQGMDEEVQGALFAKVTRLITEWATKYNMLVRRTAQDKFLIVLNHASLRQLEQSRFVILDEVRELHLNSKLPLTISIGIASHCDHLSELAQLAQSSLDMVLGRGGDQAAVKSGQRLVFYGGKTNAIEKRTRVRARVIAHALKDLIVESENIIIMGHKSPDMDSIGASIGVLKAAQTHKIPAYVVHEGTNPSIEKMMDKLAEHPSLSSHFVSPDQAIQLTQARSLVVVVDTHKASMVQEPKILQITPRIVVIDHHRRGEEFINDAFLIYLEPYASSTCELVTELLQYVHEGIKFDTIEASALLAGVMVDTKNFSMRTGSRTFEAAAYLRRNGADTAFVQSILKEDLDTYVQKAQILQRIEIKDTNIAIAAAAEENKYAQLVIAQTADMLLNITGIQASFVLARREDGLIGVSARSLGNHNVQVIMERLGGGGHFTNAAVQLTGPIEEAKEKLIEVLDQIKYEEGLHT